MTSRPVNWGDRVGKYLVFYVVLCRSLFVRVCLFYFGHCIICTFDIFKYFLYTSFTKYITINCVCFIFCRWYKNDIEVSWLCCAYITLNLTTYLLYGSTCGLYTNKCQCLVSYKYMYLHYYCGIYYANYVHNYK